MGAPIPKLTPWKEYLRKYGLDRVCEWCKANPCGCGATNDLPPPPPRDDLNPATEIR